MCISIMPASIIEHKCSYLGRGTSSCTAMATRTSGSRHSFIHPIISHRVTYKDDIITAADGDLTAHGIVANDKLVILVPSVRMAGTGSNALTTDLLLLLSHLAANI